MPDVPRDLQRQAEPEFLTVQQVAERFSVGRDRVLAWIRRGELAAVNVSGRIRARHVQFRVSLEALAHFVKSRTSPARRMSARRRSPCPQLV